MVLMLTSPCPRPVAQCVWKVEMCVLFWNRGRLDSCSTPGHSVLLGANKGFDTEFFSVRFDCVFSSHSECRINPSHDAWDLELYLLKWKMSPFKELPARKALFPWRVCARACKISLPWGLLTFIQLCIFLLFLHLGSSHQQGEVGA